MVSPSPFSRYNFDDSISSTCRDFVNLLNETIKDYYPALSRYMKQISSRKQAADKLKADLKVKRYGHVSDDDYDEEAYALLKDDHEDQDYSEDQADAQIPTILSTLKKFEAEPLPQRVEIPPPKPVLLIAVNHEHTTLRVARSIVFASLEEKLFIALKSKIINARVTVVPGKASSAGSENSEILGLKFAKKQALKHIALDIVEEYEFKEMDLFVDHVVTALTNMEKLQEELNKAESRRNTAQVKLFESQKGLSQEAVNSLAKQCMNAQEDIFHFATAYYVQIKKIFNNIPIDVSLRDVEHHETDHTVWDIEGFDVSQFSHSYRGPKAASSNPIRIAKAEMIEEYFDTEFHIRLESVMREIFMSGRAKFFALNYLKYDAETIAKDMGVTVVKTIRQIWEDIVKSYDKVPEAWRPKPRPPPVSAQ